MKREARSVLERPSDLRRTLADAVFGELRRRGLSFGVANGYDNTSLADVGRDIDVVVEPGQLAGVVQTVQDCAKAQAWPYLSGRWLGSWWPRGLYQLVLHRWTDGGTLVHLTFDLIAAPALAACVVPLYDPTCLRDERSTRALGVLKSGVLKTLAGNPNGFRRLHEAPSDLDDAAEHLRRLLGRGFTERLAASARDGRLERDWRTLRRVAQIRYLARAPFHAIQHAFMSAVRRGLGPRMAAVPNVVVVGPDGVGKSTALDHAARLLEAAFVELRRRHWRPGVLPPLRQLTGRGEEGPPGASHVPRRLPGHFSLLRLAYYWVDYLLGFILVDRKAGISEVAVNLYDRGALDFAVDPVRFGVHPKYATLILYRWSPRASRVVLLTARPEIVHARKPELSLCEITRQFDVWAQLRKRGYVTDVIDTGECSPEAVGQRIAAIVLESLPPVDRRPDSGGRADGHSE